MDRDPPATKRLSRLLLHQRDAIGTAYHVLTFQADAPLEARAGQFAMVRSAAWGHAPLLPRPMSLLTAGHRPSILIKVVGEGTRRLAHASSGEPFDLLAPLGVPWHTGSDGGHPHAPGPERRRPVLVAGGVGVAPLLFLAREMASRSWGGRDSPKPPGRAAGHDLPPLALYGARSAADFPLAADLDAVAELRLATEDGSRGTPGRVTVLLERVLDELAAAGQSPNIYTCGPEAMMAAVAGIAAGRGVPCEVSLETPMACGYGVCLGCPVPRAAQGMAESGFLYACTEGPCVDAAAIDWSGGRR